MIRENLPTFTVTMTGKFLPIQIVYERDTHRYLPNLEFHAESNFTFSERLHKSMEPFEWTMFPYINQLKERLKYPKEQMPFIVTDTFKGKDNDVTTDLRKK